MRAPTPRERERFIKVLSVMRSATVPGERRAARAAAVRLAGLWGMTVEEAARAISASPRRSAREAARASAAWRRHWATATVRMMAAVHAAEKARHRRAVEAARRRGLDRDLKSGARRPSGERRGRLRAARAAAADRSRLISALLREGVPLARVMEATGASAHEIALAFLLGRRPPRRPSSGRRRDG